MIYANYFAIIFKIQKVPDRAVQRAISQSTYQRFQEGT